MTLIADYLLKEDRKSEIGLINPDSIKITFLKKPKRIVRTNPQTNFISLPSSEKVTESIPEEGLDNLLRALSTNKFPIIDVQPPEKQFDVYSRVVNDPRYRPLLDATNKYLVAKGKFTLTQRI